MHRAAHERGFAHADHLAAELTSSQLTDLLAYHHVLDQGPDYFNAPPLMEAESIKAFVTSVKKLRKKD